MTGVDHVAVFEDARPFLMGLAYRILGSHAEAEDAVQETFCKWHTAARDDILSPRAWLTTLCTRHCINVLRSARKSRVDYIGTWLPEPIHGQADGESERALDVATSLSTAFLLLLERLTPKERAAYLLHDIFDNDYGDVAATLGVQELSCRKLVSRARARIADAKVRYSAPRERQELLLEAFHRAIASGTTGQLATLLADEVELCADGGGKVSALRDTLRGKADVLAFIEHSLSRYWQHYGWQVSDFNGGRGVMIRAGDELVALMTFAYDAAGRASNIYIMRNPDKLAHLS
ncbi:RNA polymerase sigma factor SigJ [Pseudomonas borbori]